MAKKILSIFLIVVMFASVTMITFAATPKIEVSSATAKPGDAVTLKVSLSNNPGINTFSLGFDYDTTRLELKKVELIDGIPGKFVYAEKAVWFNGENITTNGDFLSLTFNVLGNASAGDTEVAVTYNIGDISNYDEKDVSFHVVAGTVTIENEKEPETHKHDYVEVVTAPTCTSQGFTTFTCSCGDSYVGEYVGYAAHTEVVISGKSATCTSSGLTEGKKCSVCNETLVAQKTIAALGHNPGKWEVVKAAEIGKEGKEQQKCQVCNAVINERTIPALKADVYTPGDIDDNGKITAADARLVLRASAKLETLSENQKLAADVSKDKKITAADARTILRVSAKLESF